MNQESLSFYVGQLVEATTFELGYRGAWWRCKILNISQSKNKVSHTLEYIDFPDEKVHTMELYQKCDGINNNQELLMERPQFPPVYRQNEVSDAVSEYVVVADDWKVGDLVDWWYDDCFWPGKITNILGKKKEKGKVQLELFPPPFGEGGGEEEPYEAHRKDLRPSLNWSFNNGWTVPVSEGRRKGRRCAQVIKRRNQGTSVCSAGISGSHVKDPGVGTSSSVCGVETSGSVCGVETLGSVHGVETSGSVRETKDEDDGGMLLDSVAVDTIEAAVSDLEELINKINWIKSLLDDEKPSSEGRTSWTFVEHVGSSTPR